MTAAVARAAPRPTGWRRHAEVIRLSAVRQLHTRYRGSVLGVFWSFANPLLLTALYTALFGTAFAQYYGGSTSRYVASAFVGVVAVTFFLQATADALPTVVGNGGLLNKIALDPETFPLASLAANAFQQTVTTLPMLMLIAVLVTHDPVRVVLVPVVMAAILVLTAGFALALAALYVFFRDLSYLWGIIGFVLWLSSPVFYPAQLVPPQIRAYLTVNPVGMSIASLRAVTIESGRLDAGGIAVFVLVACAIGAIGHLCFRALRREFMDLL